MAGGCGAGGRTLGVPRQGHRHPGGGSVRGSPDEGLSSGLRKQILSLEVSLEAALEASHLSLSGSGAGSWLDVVQKETQAQPGQGGVPEHLPVPHPLCTHKAAKVLLPCFAARRWLTPTNDTYTLPGGPLPKWCLLLM